MDAAHARRIELRKVKLTPWIISRRNWARSNCLCECSCESSDVKRLIVFVLMALTASIARAEQIEITSPDQAYTFAYGAVFSHQVERNPLTKQLIANVTFSNYPYAGDRQPRCDETFDFRFPGLRFDAAHQTFFARTGHNEWIPVAEWRSSIPYGGYELAPGARIFLLKRSGHVTAVLSASKPARDGARWVENDDNLSLQNLLTGCFAVFCR